MATELPAITTKRGVRIHPSSRLPAGLLPAEANFAPASTTTRTVRPAAKRSAYFPRTPPLKSYSARISSRTASRAFLRCSSAP